ncbi:MAG: TerB family tellurite resistance protein [Cytophagaceae bacterium]|jgi:uncharacterized membrane protein YebE (DUF533 family)|nr:TerB family tellurite resistance protein [Cytophagaceae bacterium]
MFSLFGLKKDKLNRGNLKNLIALAKADGVIADSELKMLYMVGKRLGMKEDEVNAAIKDSSKIEYKVPSNDAERFEHLYELIEMMLVDGAIEENEIDFCIEISENLGFKKSVVGVLVRKVSMGIQNGVDKETLKKEAQSFLNM